MSHICDGHDPACLGCVTAARRHERLRAAMTVDDRLDDLQRARLWGPIAERIADRAHPGLPRRRWPIYVAGAAAAAAAITFMITSKGRDPRGDAAVLIAPSETSLSTRLGPHTRATLVGPGRVEIVGTPADATAIRIASGTLLADFAGGPGRSLHIVAPGLTVDVVGTLFAVEVRDHASCVSVAHGKVRVTTSSGGSDVASGQRLCTDEPGMPRAITPAIRDALADHDATIAAREAQPSPPPRADALHAPAAPPASPQPALAQPPVVQSPVAQPPVVQSPVVQPPVVQPPVVQPPVVVQPAAAQPPAPEVQDPRPSPVRPMKASSHTVAGSPATLASTAPGANDNARPPPVEQLPATVPPEPTPPPPSTSLPPAPPSPEELYRAAEAALAAHEPDRADRALARLVAAAPGSPLVDQALYDRARIAYQRHAWTQARGHLDQLVEIPHTPLAEPGRYLACRIAVESRDGDAARCLTEYRASYPHSPHDLDVLSLLVELAHARGGCQAAAPLVDELVRAHPDAGSTRSWRQRCPESR